MTPLLSIFLNNLLPVFLAAGAGYLLSKYLKVSPRPLSQVILYIFGPCLVFSLLTQNNLSNTDIIRVMLFIGILIGIIGFLTWVVGKFLRLEREILAAVMLTTMFMNAGNFGLPVVNFAFGESVLGYASILFVTMSILSYTVGIIIASSGRTNFPKALLNLLKIPTIYALLLAIFFMSTNVQVPKFFDRTINLLASASIPSMLVLLGMQLKTIRLKIRIWPMILAVSMRLLISPIIAFFLTSGFGMLGPQRQAAIIISAMPTAVVTTVLATEYDTKPSFVTAVVFITLLLSPFTLTPILFFLGA